MVIIGLHHKLGYSALSGLGENGDIGDVEELFIGLKILIIKWQRLQNSDSGQIIGVKGFSFERKGKTFFFAPFQF